MQRYKAQGWCEKAPAARGGCANFATGKKAKAAKAKGKKKAREQRKRDAEAQEAKAQEAREREAAEREAAKREAQRQRFEASSVRTSVSAPAGGFAVANAEAPDGPLVRPLR